MTRYIVLGRSAQAQAWRREQELARRQVIVVSPGQYTGVLRGLSGDFELIELESWSKATARVRRLVEQDLQIIRATRAGGGR